jgi:hypothetical protein
MIRYILESAKHRHYLERPKNIFFWSEPIEE